MQERKERDRQGLKRRNKRSKLTIRRPKQNQKISILTDKQRNNEKEEKDRKKFREEEEESREKDKFNASTGSDRYPIERDLNVMLPSSKWNTKCASLSHKRRSRSLMVKTPDSDSYSFLVPMLSLHLFPFYHVFGVRAYFQECIQMSTFLN